MSLLGNLFTSSIGRKFLMAVSGLLLVGFVAGHLAGNLQIFAAPDHINGYAHFLQSLGPLLWAVRLGLLALVAVHIWAAVVLTLENNAARGTTRYGVNRFIQASIASRYMRMSGFVVLAFILYHLAHFTLGYGGTPFKTELKPWVMLEDVQEFGIPLASKGMVVPDVYSMVFLGFKNPLIAAFYILATGLLSLHLKHGIDSMFQTLGWRSYKWACQLRCGATLFCLLYFLGSLSIPGAILTGLLKPASGTAAADFIHTSILTPTAAGLAQR